MCCLLFTRGKQHFTSARSCKGADLFSYLASHDHTCTLRGAAYGMSGSNLTQVQVAKSMLAHAGVLPFAKRGDERGNNLVRLQQMFPRIVAANFAQPHHISPECKHLLSRLLTADPEKRITVAEILQHPWFRRDLAPGTADMNYNLLQVVFKTLSSFTQF